MTNHCGSAPLFIWGGQIDVTTWGIDYDIDSDNNNGFNFPDNSDWEEFIESHDHATGKLLYTASSHYTPTRIRLPQGLDENDPTITVQLNFDALGQSGIIKLWNTHEADANRVDEEIDSGGNLPGNRILQSVDYTLADLNYDTSTGGITVYVEAIAVFDGHDTKKDIDDNGKPIDSITAVLALPDLPELSDEVQYMVVRPDTFYPHLIRLDNKGEQIRNALANQAVYPYKGAPQFALELLLQDDDHNDLVELGIPKDIAGLIEDASPGFKAALYREYVSGTYILSFAGTDDWEDILTDVVQGLGGFDEQYERAAIIGDGLGKLDFFEDKLIVTGHSLGGGLAAMASIAGDIRADTFNAAGLHRNSLLARDVNNDILDPEQEIFPGILARYEAASDGLIEAYHLDWDILSAFQYTVNINEQLIQDAIGTRIEMDGPVDFEIGVAGLALAGQIASGAGILVIVGNLGAVGYHMGLAHTTNYYLYGVFVDDAIGWDIYGYDL